MTSDTRAGTRRISGAVVGLALAAAGCGGGSLPPTADADQARAALVVALDTWRDGGAADALTGRTPPVYFNDPKYRAGQKLVGYKLDADHAPHGQSVRISGQLTLLQPDGTTKDRRAAYLIDTTPAVVIVPDQP